MTDYVEITKINRDSSEQFKLLMSDYLKDLSQYTDDLKPNNDGIYEYDGFELLFEKEAILPFYITVKDEIVGFVIVTQKDYTPEGIDYCVHELFINPKHRLKHVAKTAITKVFRLFKGKYRVVQLMDNKPAISFWRHVFRDLKIDYLESTRDIDGCKCYVQTFVT